MPLLYGDIPLAMFSQILVMEEGDDSTVLLFALGRMPESDTRLTFPGDRALAGRFKTWLPGP